MSETLMVGCYIDSDYPAFVSVAQYNAALENTYDEYGEIPLELYDRVQAVREAWVKVQQELREALQ